MRPRPGPSLPRSLLEEIDSASGNNGRRKGPKVSRKDARKQEREERKLKKANYFTSKPQASKRHAEDDPVDGRERKRVRVSEECSSSKEKSLHTHRGEPSKQAIPKKTSEAAKTDPRKSATPKPQAKSQKSETALEKLARRTNGSAVLKANRSKEETGEDAYISYLESKLGWSKGGARTSKYGKGLEEDGLDDLLRDLDSLETSLFSPSKPEDAHSDGDELSAEEEWVGGSEEDDSSESEEELGDEEGTDDSEDGEDVSEGDDDEEELTEDDRVPSQDADSEDEWGGFGEDATTETSTTDPLPSNAPPKAGSAYVPPHLRNRTPESASETEARMKLTRQLKGLLNRMSEQNIASIVDGVEELYSSHRRHDVTETITTLIIDGISAHSLLLDSYVVLHAAFIASLHKIVGVEFAAYFVQSAVSSYENHFTSLQSTKQTSEATSDQVDEATKGKECSNLIVLVSELYNFQVISCILVYDLIKGLLDGELTEFKVELLLKITRNSGQQLRSDDPSALKDIIQIVHSKLPDQQTAMSSRTKFMVETLTNLKNNRIKKAASTPAADTVDRLKKFLSGLGKKKHVRSHEPLRVSLADLHSAESKGKWWLVGAAWGGDPLVEHQNETQQSKSQNDLGEHTLVKLAKKQGMNTDIRRSIFVVLMSSEDYVDACERLSQLRLTEIQQREIIRVILHCCGNEKSFNPYYTFVGQQLCRTSHSHKITLQFCLWDFLRDLGEANVGGTEVLKNMNDDGPGFELNKISSSRLRNVARSFAWWIAKDSLTLAILKPVDFTVLKPQTLQFFIELFTHIFCDVQLSAPLLGADPKELPDTKNRGPLEEVFIKASKLETLSLGLLYFLGQRYIQETEHPFLHWAAKVATETLRTGVDIIPTL